LLRPLKLRCFRPSQPVIDGISAWLPDSTQVPGEAASASLRCRCSSASARRSASSSCCSRARFRRRSSARRLRNITDRHLLARGKVQSRLSYDYTGLRRLTPETRTLRLRTRQSLRLFAPSRPQQPTSRTEVSNGSDANRYPNRARSHPSTPKPTEHAKALLRVMATWCCTAAAATWAARRPCRRWPRRPA